jgi:hypothetical protein
MPIAQPPKPTRNSEANGRNQCPSRLPAKLSDQVGSTSKL